jgi:geranylgeranyl pyrophosphate synthase
MKSQAMGIKSQVTGMKRPSMTPTSLASVWSMGAGSTTCLPVPPIREVHCSALSAGAFGPPDGGSSALPSPLTFDEVLRRYGGEIGQIVLESNGASGLLGEMIDYHLATGGKRMRALLPVWVCVNLGGAAEAALDLGAGLELLHNATLVHDDLQDGDTHRRGRPAVWHRWSMAQAINTGDALIFQALARIARAPSAPRILPYLAEALVRVVEGQALDFQLQLPLEHEAFVAPTKERWEAMARSKTGALFAVCMYTGAAAAGAGDIVLDAAARFGEELGLLFQVQDDYLDLVGDKGRERRGRDLLEGKLSFPVVWAYEHASPADLAPIRGILERPRAERTWAMVDEALAALNRCGALAATAAWLRAAAEAAERHTMAKVVPGLSARCLTPVAHALGQAGNRSPAGSEPAILGDN